MALDRKNPPAIHDAVEFDYALQPVNTMQLDNGLPLYWLNAGVQEVVEVDWVLPAGMWHEPLPGVAQATAGLLKSGTTSRTSQQINEALEFYGASLKVKPGNDHTTISLFTLTKHLPGLLPIVHELLTASVFPQHEVELYQQNTLQRLLVSLRECEFVANQKIDAYLFGEDHPYGRFTKKESIEALTRDHIVDFYTRTYQAAGVKIFMAGLVGEKETRLVNDIFGRPVSGQSPTANPVYDIHTSAERIHHITNDENGVQGAIRIGRLFPNRHHPDFAPMVVVNTLFGGYFGSRLMSNIREDKGYTYGIYSSMSPMAHAGSLIIHTEVGRHVLENAVKEIYHEMDMMCSKQVEEEELLLVKNYLLGNLLGDLDGPFQMIQRWRTLILNGLDVNHFNRNIQVYKNITPAEVQALAQKYLDKESFHQLVVV